LERARANSQQLQSAAIDVNLAREDRTQARAALLPSVNYLNQYLYTQGNGTDSGIFVGSDGVHIYNSQAQVHQELFSPERMAAYRRTIAAQSLAAAKRDVVERGLVATVMQNYYAAVSAERKSANAQRSLEEAQSFLSLTQKLETGGEVARADVLKAQLVLQQRQRDLQDAGLAVDKARIALSVLMFPDYRLDFRLVDDLASPGALPAYNEIEAVAQSKSPELRVAEESVRQEEFAIQIARAAYMPTLSLDYFFGINSRQFAAHDAEGLNRLGSAAQATLNIPVWDWWTNRSKVRQAGMRRQQAELELELARRQLLSNLHALHLEAQAALAQLDSLKRSMEDAVESLRLTRLRYEAGDGSALEVVDAQSTLAQARNAYDDGLSRYRVALAIIQILTGMI
jgi:outer membrane protein TolC